MQDVVGYKIYRGTSTGIYDYEKDVGNATTTVVAGHDSGKDYYFSATAYNSDGDESIFCNEVKVSVPPVDTDGDGISDLDEINVYGTDPSNPDSDSDCLTDGFEVSSGSDPSSYDPAPAQSQPPSAVDDLYRVSSNGFLSVVSPEGVLANDTDPEGEALSAALVGGPSRGSLELFSDGSFTYTPDTGFSGTDSFAYQASDGSQSGNTATVSIRVESAVASTVRVTEGLVTLYDFMEGAGSTVHDVSGFGTPLDLSISNISAVNWMAGGGLSLDAPVTITSTDAATKVIAALQDTNAFTVEAWVKPANTTQKGPARIVTCSANPKVKQNFMLGTGHWGSSPTDVVDARLFGKTLSSPGGSLSTNLTHLVFTRESNGAVKVYIDGVLQRSSMVTGDFSTWNKSFPLVLGNEPTGDRPWRGEMHLVAIYDRPLPINEIELNYAAGPAAVSDNQLPGSVDPGDNQVPVYSTPEARDDTYNTAADTEFVVPATEGVLSNDDDSDGDTLIAVLVGGSGPSSGSLVLNANGSLTYTPYTGFSGADYFSYYAEDPSGKKEMAKVTINVEPPIDSVPAAKDDHYKVAADTKLTVVSSEGVLANDTDPEGEALSAALVGGPSRGSLELFSDGSFTYTPDTGFSGTDSFAYQASDGSQSGNTATVSIRVESAVASTVRVTEGLVTLYDFMEGAGSTVHDVSGFGTPLDLSISNISAVNWMAGGGLSLDAPVTITSTDAATKVIAALQDTNAFTVEAWVKPANTTQKGPARIVTCSANPKVKQNFMLGTGHWGSSPTDVVDARLFGKTLSSPGGSLSTNLTHLVFTRESNGAVKVYIDGVLQRSSMVTGDFSTWNKSFPLVLGNEPTGDRPWRGEMHLIAIYNRALSLSEIAANNEAGL